MSCKHTPSKIAVAWLLINVSRNPTASNCVFVRFCDVLWPNKNNGPTVSRLHWDSFLSPQQKPCWGRQATSGQDWVMKASTDHWIQVVARVHLLFDCMQVPQVSINTSQGQQKQNLGVGEQNAIEQQSSCITEYSSNRNRFGAKRKEKNKPALFEHLMRWQTAKSALSCGS